MRTSRKYLLMPESRCTRPRSTSCATATAVMTLLIDPIRTMVESVIGRRLSTSAKPYPFEKITRPPLTTVTTAPGIRSAAIAAGTTESRSDPSPDALCADATRVRQQTRRATLSFRMTQRSAAARVSDRWNVTNWPRDGANSKGDLGRRGDRGRRGNVIASPRFPRRARHPLPLARLQERAKFGAMGSTRGDARAVLHRQHILAVHVRL